MIFLTKLSCDEIHILSGCDERNVQKDVSLCVSWVKTFILTEELSVIPYI